MGSCCHQTLAGKRIAQSTLPTSAVDSAALPGGRVIGRLLQVWLAAREVRESVAADPSRASELPAVALACEAAGLAWERAVFCPFASRRDAGEGEL